MPGLRRNDHRILTTQTLTAADLGGSLGAIQEQLTTFNGQLDVAALRARGFGEAVLERLARAVKLGYRPAQMAQVDAQDRDRYLVLEREEVELSSESDIISVYNIAAYALNRFFILAQNPLGSSIDRQTIRHKAKQELGDLGINATRVEALVRSFLDIRRRLSRRRNQAEQEVLKEDERHQILSGELLAASRSSQHAALLSKLASDLGSGLLSALKKNGKLSSVWLFEWARSHRWPLTETDAQVLHESVLLPAIFALQEEEKIVARTSVLRRIPQLDRKRQGHFVQLIQDSGLLERFLLKNERGTLMGAVECADGSILNASLRAGNTPAAMSAGRGRGDDGEVTLFGRRRLRVQDGDFASRTIEIIHATATRP
jgi:hypothetical protein